MAVLERIRRPGAVLVLGFALLVFGVIPLLPGGARIAVFAVGLVLALVAVGQINARRASGRSVPPTRPSEYGGHEGT